MAEYPIKHYPREQLPLNARTWRCGTGRPRFTLSEDIGLHGASMKVPSFTKGKQLTQEETEKSKQVSRVRVHVEGIIGLLKNRYAILKGTLSVSMLKHKDDVGVANIDKLW